MTEEKLEVPNLPGYVSNHPEGDQFAKGHLFDVVDGLPVLEEKKCNKIKPSSLKTIPTNTTFYGERKIISDPSAKTKFTTINALPKWVAYDRDVLRFWCHFTETILYSNTESLRYRHFVLYYYLEDDTIHISELKQENSGMAQGLYLKRQKVPMHTEDRFIEWNDIGVNKTLTIHGQEFKVDSCDTHSRQFFERQGVQLEENQPSPLDFYTVKREAAQELPPTDTTISSYLESRCGKTHSWQFHKERQFFAHDRKVLRFWAIWNDPAVYGQIHHYEVNYFLADDTIAAYEIYPENAGAVPFPAFLSRTKLPKNLPETGVALIGVDHEDDIDYVHCQDLRVGGYLTIYGRHMLLARADEYTIEFYNDMYGVPKIEFEPIEEEEYEYRIPSARLPPHNGYGTEEDSLGSVKHLVPRVPRKDFHKLLKYDNTVLRFKAKLIGGPKQNEDRRFVIEFYRSNDTLKIYECRSHNSGFLGGKFLERSRLKNTATKNWFKASEFFVGAEVTINGFVFKFMEADESTLNHMEENGEHFQMANKDTILKKLADKLWDRCNRRTDTFRLIDSNHDSKITAEEFQDVMTMYGWTLNEHELLTIWRCYDEEGKGYITFSEFFKTLERYKHGKLETE